MSKPKIFLSMASTEYEAVRKRLTSYLTRAGCDVEVQERFPQSTVDTVQKLAEQINHPADGPCTLVIHVVGHQPGSIADPTFVDSFFKTTDHQQFLAEHPTLAEGLGDFSGLTYTQWEAFFALHFGVGLLVYTPETAFGDDGQLRDDFAQRQHLSRLESIGRFASLYPEQDLYGFVMADLIAELRKRVAPADLPIAFSKPNNLPLTSIGELFKGREEELKQIKQRLTRGAVAITANNKVASSERASEATTADNPTSKPTALSGSGGIGKTRTALEYAYQNEEEYSALLFVTADSPESLDASLANLHGVLAIEGLDEAPDDVRLREVLRWLREHTGWLAILDNVDSSEAAEAVQQRLADLNNGDVLITSRWARWSDAVEKLELNVLSLEASVEYLIASTIDRTVIEGEEQHAESVANRVGQLALGLEHARAYINRHQFSFKEYDQLWEQDCAEILAEFDKTQISYPRELLVTWQLSVNRLSQSARRLLEVCCWFSADPIPESVLGHLPEGTLEIAPRLALAELADYSLVSRERAGDQRMFGFHRLVQETTRLSLEVDLSSETQTPSSLVDALSTLNAVFVGDSTDVRNWPVLEPLMEHAIEICDRAVEKNYFGDGIPTSRLLNTVGLMLEDKVRFSKAEKCYRTAIEIDETSYGDDHPLVSRNINNLAHLLGNTNRLEEAVTLMRRVLKLDQASFGDTHAIVASDLNNLAFLLDMSNQLEEAEMLIRRALEIDRSLSGENHPSVTRDLINLSRLLHQTDRLEEAERLMRKAMEIDEAVFGQNHPRIATQLANLALLLQDTNRHDEAEPLFQRALKIDKVYYGKDHPRIATHLNNLASLLFNTQREYEAEPLQRTALKIDKASFGEDHPDVARDLNNLAQILIKTERHAEAEPLMRRALEIDRASFGENHPNVARDLNNMAVLLKTTFREQEAERLVRQALAIGEASLGENHPNMATYLQNLASLLYDSDRLAEAEPLMQRALDILTTSYGDDHPQTKTVANGLAFLRSEMDGEAG
ncbi:MAG: tetratricopeptide repeat protein [Planctomycetota bacterium]